MARALKCALMTVAALILTLGAAPVMAQNNGLMKVEGTVVMVTPDTLHLDVNGEIRTLELDPASKLEPGISEGQYITVWYRNSALPGKVVVTHSERRASAKSTAAKAPETIWKTERGTLELITPAVLEIDVNGQLRTLKRGPDTKIESGIVQGDTVTVRYREQDMTPAEVKLVSHVQGSPATMPSRQSPQRMTESEHATTATTGTAGGSVATAQEPGAKAPSPGSWPAVDARADRLPSRLPTTASQEPLALLVGLMGVALGGSLLAFGRSRS